MSAPSINLHAFLPRSRANGPGWRSVLWFQGCTLGCPGCFNPETHAPEPRQWVSPADLVARCLAVRGTEGVTISGGEPLQQARGLSDFLQLLRTQSRLSVVLFSGYTRSEIESLPWGYEVLGRVDLLIAGRYDRTQACDDALRASRNQETHFLTSRYAAADLDRPLAEVILHSDGRVIVTGFPTHPACRSRRGAEQRDPG